MTEAIAAPAPQETGAAEPESEQPDTAAVPKEGAPETPPEEPKKVRLSPQLAALQRMEAQTRREREALAAEKKALEEARAKHETEAAERARLKKEKPLEWLQAEGWDYDALTEAVVQEGTPEAKLKAALEARLGGQSKQVEELQAKLEALEKEREADRQKANEAQAQAFRAKVETAIRGNEAFELTAADPQGMDTVWELIVEHAHRTGQVMAPEEAAAKVEAALRQRAEALLQTKFARGKLTPEVERVVPATSDRPRSVPPRTLTNSPAATTTAPKGPARRETREERINRVIARLGG